MITSYLQGGLGNQMFQIAAAYSLSLKIGTDYSFDFNTSFVSTQGHKANKYKDNLFKNINNSNLNLNSFIQYREPNFRFNELPPIDNICLIGNFQSEKYFIENKQKTIELFNFDIKKNNEIKKLIYDKIGNNTITGIHVRRGDYLLKPNFHPTCNITYYQKGMELIGDKYYMIVSDDIEWCKNNFIGDNFIFSPFTSEIDDLYLLINCDNHIIANSSFSWWGAYLCEKENKVVSPKIWFGEQGPQDTEDIYINDWIKI